MRRSARPSEASDLTRFAYSVDEGRTQQIGAMRDGIVEP